MRRLIQLTLAIAVASQVVSQVAWGESAAAAPSTYATTTIQGNLLDDGGMPIARGSVTINGALPAPAVDGAYSAVVDESPLYEIRYEADGHYPFVHTFDQGELASVGGKLPAVTLVARKPGRVLLVFGGDTMMGRRFEEPFEGEPQWIRPGHELEDGKGLLRHIKSYLELADFASVNLETPLIADEPVEKAEKAYTFYSHPDTLGALHWAGVDFVTLGNNHTYDYLESGMRSTLAALEQSPVAYSGAGMTAAQALAAHRTEIGDERFSFLGYVGWKGRSTPNQVAEGDSKGGAAYGTKANIVATVEREAADGRVVVVQYHGGNEYADAPTRIVRARMKAAIDHGADLVVCHHPHVLQGMELYDGKLIAYSIGNFLFDQYRYETHQSALLYVWMDGQEFHRAEIVPIYVKNYHTTPATGKMRDWVLGRLAHQSAGDGLSLGVSGGHGVISTRSVGAEPPPLQVEMQRSLPVAGHSVVPLPVKWYERSLTVHLPPGQANPRFGTDLLLWGDYEQHQLYGLEDSSWWITGSASGITDTAAHSGRYALELGPSDSAGTSAATQRYFLRVFEPNSPMSLVGYASTTGQAELNVFLDHWPSKWSRARALAQRTGKDAVKLPLAKGNWRQFVIDVEPPGKDVKGLRVRLQNGSAESPPSDSVFIDDLALVSWESTDSQSAPSGRSFPSDECRYVYLGEDAASNDVVQLDVVDTTGLTAN